MSGTSGDGVDASLIQSNGTNYYESIQDKYYEYDESIYKKIHLLKKKINYKMIQKNFKTSELERQITIFHAKIIKI